MEYSVFYYIYCILLAVYRRRKMYVDMSIISAFSGLFAVDNFVDNGDK